MSACCEAAPIIRDVRFVVEVATKGSNAREHPMARATRVAKERLAVARTWLSLVPRGGWPWFLEPEFVLRVPRGVPKKDRALAKKTGADLRAQFIILKPALPLVVELTRISFGKLDDDNLRAALKGVRDEIAWQLGINDRDPIVRWDYDSPGQEHGPKKYQAVRVRIRAADLGRGAT